MAVFFVYVLRSLFARSRANALTLLAVALFVAGGSTGLAFYLRLKHLLLDTAPPDNIIVVSKGAPLESASRLPLEAARKVVLLDGVKRDGNVAVAATEVVSRVYLDSADFKLQQESVPIRGIDEKSLQVHHIVLLDGSPPKPGTLEIMLGRHVAARYNAKVGNELLLPGGKAPITGIFAADGGLFEHEVWTPRTAIELHLKAKLVSSVTLVAQDVGNVPAIVDKINSSKDIDAQAASVKDFREREAGLNKVATVVLLLLVLLSIVATSAIATTMNAAVVMRLPELASLAAIGIRRSALGRMVLFESIALAVFGAILGVFVGMAVRHLLGAIALGANPVELSWSLIDLLVGLALGFVVGLVGGIRPMIIVRRLDIIGAMR